MRNLLHTVYGLCIILSLSVEAAVAMPLIDAEPKSLRIFPDLAGHWFLDGRLDFGCEVIYTNGARRRTAGYLHGNLLWSGFQCVSRQGYFDRGVCMVDMAEVTRNENMLVIEVSMVDYPLIKHTFKIKVPALTALVVSLPAKARLRDGEVLEPLVTAEYSNGLAYTFNPGSADALIPTDSLELFFNKERIWDGTIELPHYEAGMSRSSSISALWKSMPWINDRLPIVVQGKKNLELVFPAADGADGRAQSDAPKGMNGVEGFFGQPGADGQPVVLQVRWIERKQRLLVATECNGKWITHEFNPLTTSLTLVARGGKGGRGGRGGMGGNASFADSFAAGEGGPGGRGGKGGKGSSVKIVCSPDAKIYLPAIIIDNTGGEGGYGGPGGRGGLMGDPMHVYSLRDFFLPARYYPGETGLEGEAGEDGGDVEVDIISR